MNEKNEFKYVQFPNCLLMQTYESIDNGLRMILDYGIVHYAKKQPYELHDVARQVCYDYRRNWNLLQPSIINTIRLAENNDEFSEIDYDGFSWTSFNPEDNINEILALFGKDSLFKKTCILNYQIHLACSQDQLSIKLGSYQRTIETYDKAIKIQEAFERQFGPDAMPYCKVSMLREFIDNPKDIDLFRAYVGIKSMIGRRNFISSNKPAILSRMIGCKTKSAFEYFTTDRHGKKKNLLPTVETYSNRYRMDKLLSTLAERKYIMYLSKKKVSVIYLSKYMEPEELGKLIKETKERQNIKQRIRDAAASL
jgi:hypothetical protein